MSADAKAWKNGEGHWLDWQGIYDGECPDERQHRDVDLAELLAGIERCMAVRALRWETRVYPDGQVGLRGFTW